MGALVVRWDLWLAGWIPQPRYIGSLRVLNVALVRFKWLWMIMFLLLSVKVTRKNWAFFYLDDPEHLSLLLFIHCRPSKDLIRWYLTKSNKWNWLSTSSSTSSSQSLSSRTLLPSIIFLAMSMVTRCIFSCFIAPLECFSFRYMTYRSKTLTFSFFSVPSLYNASQL